MRLVDRHVRDLGNMQAAEFHGQGFWLEAGTVTAGARGDRLVARQFVADPR